MTIVHCVKCSDFKENYLILEYACLLLILGFSEASFAIIVSESRSFVIILLIFLFSGFVGNGVTVTDRCVIGSCCTIDSKEETISPGTVITGNDHMRWNKEATTQVSKHYGTCTGTCTCTCIHSYAVYMYM